MCTISWLFSLPSYFVCCYFHLVYPHNIILVFYFFFLFFLLMRKRSIIYLVVSKSKQFREITCNVKNTVINCLTLHLPSLYITSQAEARLKITWVQHSWATRASLREQLYRIQRNYAFCGLDFFQCIVTTVSISVSKPLVKENLS